MCRMWPAFRHSARGRVCLRSVDARIDRGAAARGDGIAGWRWLGGVRARSGWWHGVAPARHDGRSSAGPAAGDAAALLLVMRPVFFLPLGASLLLASRASGQATSTSVTRGALRRVHRRDRIRAGGGRHLIVRELLPGAMRDRSGSAVLVLGSGAPRRLVACPLDEPGWVVGGVRGRWLPDTAPRAGAAAVAALRPAAGGPSRHAVRALGTGPRRGGGAVRPPDTRARRGTGRAVQRRRCAGRRRCFQRRGSAGASGVGVLTPVYA